MSRMTHKPKIDLNAPVGDRVAKTTCYMCACRCGIDVYIRDGKVRYIEGNRDHPVNKGVLCGKGSAGIMQHYSPARLQAPMKRVGAARLRRIRGDLVGRGLGPRHRLDGRVSERPTPSASRSSPGAIRASR